MIENGEMLVPQGPGLGVDLNLEALTRYPPKTYSLRHYGGTLTNIRPVDAKPFKRLAVGRTRLRRDGGAGSGYAALTLRIPGNALHPRRFPEP